MSRCPTGKRRFRDELAAKLVLLQAERSRSKRRRETRAYACKLCRGWHLTSQDSR